MHAKGTQRMNGHGKISPQKKVSQRRRNLRAKHIIGAGNTSNG